jgi:IPT/TIG domain-containing protein/type IX secretion system substrate protein
MRSPEPTTAPRIFLFSSLLAASVLAVTPRFCHAAWTPDGVAACAAAGPQVHPHAVADGTGGVIVVWQDSRRGDNVWDVYAQRITAGGAIAAGWPPNGRVLCASGSAYAAAGPALAVPDGAGGALVLWGDGRVPRGIYAQRVNAGGQLAPGWPSDGRLIAGADASGNFPIRLWSVLPDGEGGAYLAREDQEATNAFHWAAISRITADGAVAPGWTESGMVFLTGAFGDYVRFLDLRPSSVVMDVSPPIITSFAPTSGWAGTVVTIDGANFATTTSVLFSAGGAAAAASFSVLSDTRLRATVPANATTGPVSVFNLASGTTSGTNFTLLPPSVSGFAPAQGPVGTVVTVDGVGFAGASAVRFNGTAAAFTIESGTRLRATVPAGATSGPIAVTNPTDTAASTASFTVILLPTISSFVPDHGLPGTEVTVNGSSFATASAVSFNGTAASFTVDSEVRLRATVPIGATAGPIRVTNPAGTGTSAQSFDPFGLPIAGSPGNARFETGSGAPGLQATAAGVNALQRNGSGPAWTAGGEPQLFTTMPAAASTGPGGVTPPPGTRTSDVQPTFHVPEVLVSVGFRRDPSPETWFSGHVHRIRFNGVLVESVDLPSHRSGPSSFQGTLYAAAASDGNGGFFSSWHDYWESGSQAYYAQHYSADGAPQWPVDLPSPAHFHLEPDGSGGAYFIGRPFGGADLEVHRRRGDGTMPAGWTSAGVVVSRPMTMGEVSAATFGGTLLLCWGENLTGSGLDIRSIAILPSGVVAQGWVAGGNPVCLANGEQRYPEMVPTGQNQAVACWQDERSGDSDIYVGLVDANVPTTGVGPTAGVASGIALSAPWPNPVRDRAMVSLTLSARVTPTLEILDIAGRQVRRVDLSQAGSGRRTLAVEVGDLPNGVYLMRLTQAARSTTTRFAVVR